MTMRTVLASAVLIAALTTSAPLLYAANCESTSSDPSCTNSSDTVKGDKTDMPGEAQGSDQMGGDGVPGGGTTNSQEMNSTGTDQKFQTQTDIDGESQGSDQGGDGTPGGGTTNAQ